MLPKQARDDGLGSLVRQQPLHQGALRFAWCLEAPGELQHRLRLGARAQLSIARELPLDGMNLVFEAQVVKVTNGLGADQRYGRAHAPCAPRSPCPMHVLFGGFGEVEVDHVREVGNVDASRRDVGANQEGQALLARRQHDRLALLLREIGVQPIRVITRTLQLRRDTLRIVARIAEHDGALRRFDLEDAQQLLQLVPLADVNIVLDFERADLITAERNELGLA